MEYFIYSGISNSIAKTLTSPLEIYQTFIQTSDKNKLKDIFKDGKIFKGNVLNISKTFISSGCLFYIYEKLKLKGVDKKIASIISPCVSTIIIHPIDNIITRLILKPNNVSYRSVIVQPGIKSLYNGFYTSLVGRSLYTIVNLNTFSFLKEDMKYNNFLSGLVSGSLAISVSYPTDLVRKNLFIQNTNIESQKYSGFFDCVKKIGFKGMYKGFGITILKTSIGSGIYFSLYEFFKNYF